MVAIVAPFGILFGTICSLIERKCGAYFEKIAIALDEFGNVSCSYLINVALIKEDGYQFGNRKETISSALGKNYEKKTLTLIGKVICWILNNIQKDHVIISVDHNVETKKEK